MRKKGLVLALLVAAAAVLVQRTAAPGVVAAAVPGQGMPAEVKAYFDTHPVPPEAIRSARAKAGLDSGRGAIRATVPRAGRGAGLDARVHGPQQTHTWMIDDFEGVVLDPVKWTPYDLDGPLFGEYFWGLSQCHAAKGAQSLWALGGGADGERLGCSDVYPSGANSAVLLILDFTQFPTPPSQLDFLVDYWLNTRIEDEFGVVPDGLFLSWIKPRDDGTAERMVIWAVTSQNPERFFSDPKRLDLVQAQDVYDPSREFDLSKEPAVMLEFLFMSRDPKSDEPPPTTFAGGAFIDNVRIETDVQPPASLTAASKSRQPVEPVDPRD